MAYTKTHPIKSTLNLAIAYILNPDKTDGSMLVSSFGCSPATADIEFAMTREYGKRQSPNLAHHLIQSFSPEDNITPEMAHEIGKRLADEVLGGKYEYVISTHIDRGNIHNHIIYNSVSFVDNKHYHSTPPSYYRTRRISDKLCKEYGLSVIEPSGEKGKSYTEYTADKNGTSWKAKLKEVIDAVIPQAKDFDDFIRLMIENGYEVKRGKYISFRAAGQERFTRSKTLGARYTEEAITERIAGKTRRKTQKRDSQRIGLIIDIQNNIKAQQSKGYEHWAKLQNLKQASKTINYLTENGISTYEELETKTMEVRSAFDETAGKLKTVESRIRELNIIRKHIKTYKALQPVYAEYQNAKNKSEFERLHRAELTLYRAAHKYLSEAYTDGKLPTLAMVNSERLELTEQKQELYGQYRKYKKELSELDVIKSNVDMILVDKKEPKRDRSEQLE